MKRLPAFLILLGVVYLPLHAQQVLAEHHFESSGIQSVTVIGSLCDVYVNIGDQVVFDGIIEGDGEEGDYLIASIRRGDEVVFRVERKNSGRNWNWNDIDRARIDLTIPDGTALSIDNSSGDVNIDGPASSDYTLKTTSGDIDLSELTGNLSVRSTSGDISLDQVTGSVTVQSTSGDQEIERINGSVQTQSTSGNIEIRDARGSIIAKATSGDMDVSRVEGRVNFQTTSGDIQLLRFTMSDDSEARSTSGDIDVEFTNDLNQIGFDLDATSGDLEVGNIESEDDLLLERGEFMFRGKSTSGDQTYSD